MDDYERRETDIDAAVKRIAELVDENPDMTPDLILNVLDDEFVGSSIFPSAMDLIIRETDRVWEEALMSTRN
jgi:hypothetical protein